MQQINKILIFLLFTLIWTSGIFLITLKQESEIELDISNSLLNDLLYPKYSDGTFKNDWFWTTYTDGRPPEYKTIPECNKNGWNDSCIQHIKFSNESLVGTTHIRIKAPINILDIILALYEYRKNEYME